MQMDKQAHNKRRSWLAACKLVVNRAKYITLYKEKLSVTNAGRKVPPTLLAQLHDMEQILPLEQIVHFRKLATKEHETEAGLTEKLREKEKKQRGGFFGAFRRRPDDEGDIDPSEFTLTEKQRQLMYETIAYNPDDVLPWNDAADTDVLGKFMFCLSSS